MAASTSTAMELPQDSCAAIDATPLPLPMRKKPQRRWGIGSGKHYTSVEDEAFDARTSPSGTQSILPVILLRVRCWLRSAERTARATAQKKQP